MRFTSSGSSAGSYADPTAEKTDRVVRWYRDTYIDVVFLALFIGALGHDSNPARNVPCEYDLSGSDLVLVGELEYCGVVPHGRVT